MNLFLIHIFFSETRYFSYYYNYTPQTCMSLLIYSWKEMCLKILVYSLVFVLQNVKEIYKKFAPNMLSTDGLMF